MYIKAVTIHGFKSYKDAVTIELSQACNVVVGRNGAGKSNFFAAIRFVLGDIFTHLRPEERQGLLHEGAGLAVMSAYVEVVFDNSDNRFPIDREEVVLRRSIGLKKDEYFLDKKHVSKTDVSNLLESAGFSKSNPYYIVQQGKITGMTLMKDADRLELLKEVAGCKVYDERRLESEKIMKETESRREKIIEVVKYIKDRLGELEEEKEELRAFQTLDREKRALEYTIYDKELKAARAKLQRLEDEKAELAEQLSEIHDRSMHRDNRTEDLEAQLRTAVVEEEALAKEKRAVTADIQESVKKKTTLELDMKECKEKQEENEARRENLCSDLNEIEVEIKGAEAELKKIQPNFEAELQNENDLKEQLADVERKANELYSKQGRKSQFATKADRDRHLEQEAAAMRATLEEQQQQASTFSTEVGKLARDSAAAVNGIAAQETKVAELRVEIDECANRYRGLKTQRDELSNERKELWRDSADIEARLVAKKEEVAKHERTLSTAFGRDAQRGLTAIKQLVAQKKVPAKGIYGPLIELFDVEQKFITAVEVTAGGSLSHVVVDTEQTAAKIVKALNKDKLGRVTFMPLAQLNPKPLKEYPGPPSDVIPLISRLNYDEQFQPAFRQVFGKTLIARDTATASSYSRQHQLNCVTLDGDQVNKRGAITGGFNEVSKSRILAMKKVNEAAKVRDELQAELSTREARLKELETQISDVLAAMQRAKADERSKKQDIARSKHELQQAGKAGDANAKNLGAKKQLLEKLTRTIRESEKDVEAIESEIGSPFAVRLS
eukprot:SAG11_NODE_2363_length_3459_cov_1.931548_3_plen_784_part_00